MKAIEKIRNSNNPPAGERNPAGEPTNAPPPRRERRWARRITFGLIGLVLLLVMVVALGPTLLSLRAMRDPVLARVNAAINGSIRADEWALSWTGPISVRKLSISDPAQREVVRIDDISLRGGLWQLLTGGLNLGTVTVQDGRILLQMESDNSVSIAKAFGSPKPASGDGGRLPEPKGQLVIKNIAVQVVQTDGRSFEVSDVDAKLDLQTLSNLSGQVALTLKDGGKLNGTIDVRDLVSGGKFAAEKASGTLKLSTPDAIPVGPLARFASRRDRLEGMARLDVDAKFDSTAVRTTITADLNRLLDRGLAGTDASAVDVGLKGDFTYSGDAVAGKANITSSAGTAQADARYVLSSKPPALNSRDLIAAVLNGGAIQLPEFELKAQANIDLAAVERAMPGLIKIKEGQKLTGGRFEIANLAAHGGASPAASGTLQLKDLAAHGGGGSIRIEPISIAFDTMMQPGKGLEIKAAELLASFARVQASGAAANLKTTFEANLTKLKQELGQIFDLGDFELAGQINGTFNIARAGEERVDVELKATGTQVRYSVGDRRIEIPTLSVLQVGQLAMLKNRPQRYTSTQMALNLIGQLEAAATGYFDFETRGFAADIDAKRIELAFVHAQLAGLGVSALERYAGTLGLTAKIVREGGDQLITTSGALVARALAVDGQPIADRDATLTWKEMQFDPKTTTLRIVAAKLDSALANLDASDVRFASGEKLTLSGKVDATADVAGVMRVVARVARMEKSPELAGRLTLNTTVSAEGDSLSVAGRGIVDQFIVGSGASAFKHDKVSFEADARMDQKTERINLSQLKLTSVPLSATINGTIDQYKGTQRLALRGRYDSNWDQLTAIIHQIAPDTVETIMIKGSTGSEFQINGDLNDPAARPSARGVSTGLELGWAESRLYGVQTGPAKLSPALNDGKLTLPLASITAADGKINLRGEVDFEPVEPTLIISGALPILENVSLNNRLAQDVLSWLNPIFLNIVQIEGKAHLSVQDLQMPLGESLKRSGNGRGRLDLKAVRMQPAGLMTQLVALGGLTDKGMYSAQFSAVDFVVKDGRIYYDDFTILFPGEYDMKFRGSVGFDSTLDLVVSLPVRPALLEHLGVKAIPPEYAKKLEKSRIELPLAGTRSQPRLDFSKVDTNALLKGLVPTPDSTKGAVTDLLKELGGPKPGEPKKSEPKKGEPKKSEPKKDLLKGLGGPKPGEPKKDQPKKGKP